MTTFLYPNVGAKFLLELWRTALAGCKVKLFQNNVDINPLTISSELTIATFKGYADVTVTALLPAYLDPLGGWSSQIATVQFNYDSAALTGDDTNTIFGFAVYETGGTLIAAGNFATPIVMSEDGNSIPVDLKFNMGN